MNVLTILQKNMKWRFHHAFTIVITILQPILWLILYSVVAKESMQQAGIENYTTFVFPGLMVLISFGVASSSGILNYLTKNDGSFYRILISPVQRYSIVLGQVLESILCTFLELLIMFITGLFLGINMQCNLLGILLILILISLSTFFVSCITYTISLHLPNEVLYETAMNAIVLPIFFLSSALFDTHGLHQVLHFIMQLNPFTYVVNSIRSIMLTGALWNPDIMITLILFIVLSIMAFHLALHKLKKETND